MTCTVRTAFGSTRMALSAVKHYRYERLITKIRAGALRWYNKPMTRGMAEAAFTKAMIQFEKEYLGRGPVEVRTLFLGDMILVRIQGIMTPAEQTLAATGEGRDLVKEMRRQLFEGARPLLAAMVQEVTGCNLLSLHTDMSTKSGERVVILMVDDDLDKKFQQAKSKR